MRPLPLPEPLAGVEVWRLDLDLHAPVPDADWAVLGGDEADRALRLHRHEDKVRFARTRAAVRRLLAARLRCAPQALRLAAGPRGKPRLAGEYEGGCTLDFNASHAGRFALIAIARRGAVGVDIEYRNPDLDAAALEAQVLSPAELELGASRRPEFFERWVAKEAALKAMGLGIAEHLQQISVVMPEQANGARYRLQHPCPEWPAMSAWRLEGPPGYAAALAWAASGSNTNPQ